MDFLPPIGLKWGMNQADFKKIIAAKGGRRPSPSEEVIITEVEVAGMMAFVLAGFYEDQLASVTLDMNPDDYDKVVEILKMKYGKPSFVNPKKAMLWRNLRGEIWLNQTSKHDPHFNSRTEVRYSNHKLDSLYKERDRKRDSLTKEKIIR